MRRYFVNELLGQTYFNNTVADYLIALGIIVIGLIILQIFRRMVLKALKRWSERTETTYDDLFVKAVERFGLPALNFLVIYWGITYLTLLPKVSRVVEVATAAVMAFFLIRLLSNIIQYGLEGYVRKQDGGTEKVKQMKGVLMIVNMIVWALGLIFLFDNLGYDVTAIIAGLGIGGIAVALAAQNILGDLFNYFVIFFDRPFEVGDFIVVDAKSGTVEHIGIKTTRVKSLSGEQLVFSNSDLTNSRIHNFKRLERRRILFKIGVVYQTPLEQLQKIPAIIRTIVEREKQVTLDRVHFAAYGDFSLIFEVVYFVEDSEYNVYMDIQQRINLAIFEDFKKEGIEFAYTIPAQTLILGNGAVTGEVDKKG